MAEYVNTTSTTAKQTFGDSSPYAPSFDIEISATATVLIYQGNNSDNTRLVGTITTSGVYHEAGVCDFFSIEVTANTGTVVVSVANIRG